LRLLSIALPVLAGQNRVSRSFAYIRWGQFRQPNRGQIRVAKSIRN
jgi:hypothetical protein